MPRKKAPDVEWTREILERVLEADANEVHALTDELGVERATIYSMRKRVRDQGLEAVLARRRGHGPRPGRPAQTLADELDRTYEIRGQTAGRGDIVQYTVTIPARMAEILIARFGRTVRFVPVEDGLKIVPILTPLGEDELPGWIPAEALTPDE